MPCTSLASNEAAEQKGRITVEFRYVGHSGFKISEITCGNWLTHGSQMENDQAKACVRAALDHQRPIGRSFPTAHQYCSRSLTIAEPVLLFQRLLPSCLPPRLVVRLSRSDLNECASAANTALHSRSRNVRGSPEARWRGSQLVGEICCPTRLPGLAGHQRSRSEGSV